MKKLTLTVDNTTDIEGGAQSTVVFDESGGSIGSAKDNSWVLKDRGKSVSSKHVRIFFMDGAFCMEPVVKAGIYVNDSARPITPGEPFQVQDGDTLRIGRFSMKAYVTETLGEDTLTSHGEQWAGRFVSLEPMVAGHISDMDDAGNVLDSTLNKAKRSVSLAERLAAQRKVDPVEALQETGGGRSSTRDPLAALDMEEELEARAVSSDLSDYLGSTPEDSSRVEIPDNLQPTAAYFSPPRIEGRRPAPQGRPQARASSKEDPYIAEMLRGGSARPAEAVNAVEAHIRDSWLGDVQVHDEADAPPIDHVVLRPLSQGLGLPLEDMSGPEADRLAYDIGEALRVAISGLMDIHKDELASKSLIAETHLHAIEDNPLRLAQNVEEAVRDLFIVQSPVHLSASAAIGESLKTVHNHQDASDAALDAALEAVLHALAPVALARRFLKYKGHAPRTGDLDAWHWRMYQHYYTELSSDRQGGLSRMFREVFRQVYDREMRVRSLEG